MTCKRIVLFLLCLSALFFAVSCRAAPPPVEVEPPGVQVPADRPLDGPPNQADLSALEAAAARAAQARSLAEMLDAPAVFPLEWDAAESLFEQAQRQRDTSTLGSTMESIARYERAAEAFDALTQRSAALAFELAFEQLEAAREAAIAAGAQEYTPEFLLHADNTAARGMREYEAGNFYAARDALQDAYAMYNTLTAALNAMTLREEISARGFEAHDPENIALGDEALFDAVEDFTSGYYQYALENAEKALSLFTQALITAWATIVTEAANTAAEHRQRALDYRANVAVRTEFDLAETIYNRANIALRGQDFETAVRLFDECKIMFIAVAETALERRQAAEEALRRADERLAESENIATYADELLEGGVE